VSSIGQPGRNVAIVGVLYRMCNLLPSGVVVRFYLMCKAVFARRNGQSARRDQDSLHRDDGVVRRIRYCLRPMDINRYAAYAQEGHRGAARSRRISRLYHSA